MIRLLIYASIVAALLASHGYVWFQGVGHGRNELLAEQNAAQVEQDAKDAIQRSEDITADRILSVDLSDIQDSFTALQAEVHHAKLTKPALQPVRDCGPVNPFGSDFVRLFNAGAAGGQGSSPTVAHTGDGEVPR